MDLTRFASDAGQFINRAIQYTGETIGQADKTDLDPGLEELLLLADATKTCTDKIISQTEVLLQPSTGARLEDRLYEHLEWSAPPRPRALEVLGNEMSQAGLEIGSNNPYGTALLRCGEVQKQLSEAERKFVQSTNIHFLTPLRSFTEGEHRTIQDERRMLLNKRLDLDIAKSRLKKAHEADQQSRNLNANPLDDDYMSHVSYMFSFLRVKWLKVWAQQITQVSHVHLCLHDPTEIVINIYTNHMRSLTDFVEVQACYFDQCNQHAQELQKQLSSIPAVLCSNNWHSEISNQPSTSHHVANEPTGLNQVTPIPVVQQIPDFDQDSWTAHPSSDTQKITAGSSAHTESLDPTNNNNNNNNNHHHSSDSHEISNHAAASQAFHNVRASNSENHTTAQPSAADRTVSTHVTTNATTAVSSATAAGANGAGHATTTTSSQPSQLSAAVLRPQAANAASDETMTTGAVADEPQTTDETGHDEQRAVNGVDVQESSSSASQDVVE
nr:PREDICTED: endophilin-B1-like [Paralichthys olivaceus]